MTAGTGTLRIVFFGTPAFAVPSLRALTDNAHFEVRLVVTQPDRPAGRRHRLTPAPVKELAMDLGLPVYQPATLRSAEDRAPLVAADADLFVVAAFGLIFRAKTLAIPRLGCVNIHASLLPRFRGAAPIAAAILAGDGETGISLMVMERGLDTGPVIATAQTPIEPRDTTASLTARLATIGAELLSDRLPAFAAGSILPEPQRTSGASLVRPLIKADGWLDWAQSADFLERQVRAMWPWPRAWTTFEGQPLQIHAATEASEMAGYPPGSVQLDRHGPLVQCGQGALRLLQVQLPGGRPMSGAAFSAGHPHRTDEVLGAIGRPESPPPLIVELNGASNDGGEAQP